jgi:hypothetical protein
VRTPARFAVGKNSSASRRVIATDLGEDVRGGAEAVDPEALAVTGLLQASPAD